MGKIIQILKRTPISRRMFKSIRVESAESIHIHWKDIRIKLDRKTFENLLDTLIDAYSTWVKKDFADGEGDGIVLSESFPFNDDQQEEFSIEENENSYHIHYGEFRLELQKNEFEKMSQFLKSDQCYSSGIT